MRKSVSKSNNSFCRASRVEGEISRVEGRRWREVKKFKKLVSYPILNYWIYNANRAVLLLSTFSPCDCYVSN